MGINKKKYMTMLEQQYCSCNEPEAEKGDNGGYYCLICDKEIDTPEPEYNGDEDIDIDDKGVPSILDMADLKGVEKHD